MTRRRDSNKVTEILFFLLIVFFCLYGAVVPKLQRNKEPVDRKS